MQEEIGQSINFEPSDIELYYRANLSRYTKADSSGQTPPPSFESVRNQVTQDYVREKQQEAYGKLVERMMRAENAVIYSDKVN